MVSTVVSEPSWNLHEAPGTVHASGNMRGCWGRLLQYESAIALYALLAVRAIVLLWLNDVTGEKKRGNIFFPFFSTSTDAVWAWCPGHR